MPSTLKTTLFAGAIALIATLGAVGGAQAGGRLLVPFAPYGTYLPGAYDDDDSYGCDDCSDGYVGDAEDAVAATAARAARRYLGVNVDNMLDAIDE
jgi:hypothetical protein